MQTDEEGHNYVFSVPEMPWRVCNKQNDFFHVSDPHNQKFLAWTLKQGWWSRHYEYPWAIQFAQAGEVVADMGCGYTFRPFKDALASICDIVYAVDADERLLSQEYPDNMLLHIWDFTERTPLDDDALDTLFCISVLEDVGKKIPLALAEFRRLIKPDGLIVLTFDVPYDIDKPCVPWPGVNLDNFIQTVQEVGLEFDEPISMNRNDVIAHEEFNLTVYHCVLRKV